jgi:hypothetical protein
MTKYFDRVIHLCLLKTASASSVRSSCAAGHRPSPHESSSSYRTSRYSSFRRKRPIVQPTITAPQRYSGKPEYRKCASSIAFVVAKWLLDVTRDRRDWHQPLKSLAVAPPHRFAGCSFAQRFFALILSCETLSVFSRFGYGGNAARTEMEESHAAFFRKPGTQAGFLKEPPFMGIARELAAMVWPSWAGWREFVA